MVLQDYPEWRVSHQPQDYQKTLDEQERRAESIHYGTEPELIWFLEHPPLYTAGTSACSDDLLDHNRFPVYQAGRGGQYTYHGPGQRVVYLMLDLKKRGCDLRRFVHDLEQWLIVTLAEFDISGERREGRIGIWVTRNDGQEKKIAAIGIRIRRWISFHGIALNVSPNLSHFEGIVPCGIRGYGVTSLQDIGCKATMEEVDQALRKNFDLIFLAG